MEEGVVLEKNYLLIKLLIILLRTREGFS